MKNNSKNLADHQTNIHLIYLIGGIIIFISILTFFFIPYLGSKVRSIARDYGYGSAKRFYFVVADIELYLFIFCFLILILGVVIISYGYVILKKQ